VCSREGMARGRHVIEDALAVMGQPGAGAVAIKKGHAETLLETGQPAARRGLAQSQVVGGAIDAAGLDDGKKNAEVVPCQSLREVLLQR